MLTQPILPVADPVSCSDLTERQAAVWRAMRYLQASNGGVAPSRAEIGTMLCMTPTGAASHFPALERKGYIVPAQRSRVAAWMAVVPDTATAAPVAPLVAVDCLPVPGGPQPENGWTARQIQVWRTMIEIQEREGLPPTQEALGRALGMHTVQGVRTHFKKLEAGGFVVNRRRLWFAVRKEVPCASLPSTIPPTTSSPLDSGEPPRE